MKNLSAPISKPLEAWLKWLSSVTATPVDPADSDSVGAGIKNLRLGIMHDFVPEERIVERVLVKHGLVG